MDPDFFMSVDRSVVAITIVAGLVVVTGQLTRMRRAGLLHRTIREAIGSNSPLAPALLDKLDSKPLPEEDQRTGIILLAIAAALILFGLIQGGLDLLRPFAGAAMFPAAVGGALLARAAVAGRASRAD